MDSAREDRLERLFEQASAMPPTRRDAWLGEACVGDPALRAELEALLARAADARDFADRVIGPAVARATGRVWDERRAAADADAEALIGQRVADFRIVEKLGGGGMGLVYKALDLRLDRLVALKVLPPHLAADEAAKRRLIREARAASALDHPNICAIHEIGETDAGRLFIAMACYEGETLKQKIARGPLPVDEALSCFAQIVAGLRRAHEAGIVHRDIKPANVMVTALGLVKVVDFGLAKMADADLTREGAAMGTVAYMSPEQTRGEALDARTDVWSAGVVLYEMLTGRRPFRGDSDQTLIHAIRHDTPDPVDRLRPELPAGVAALVRGCLERDVARRFQDARSVEEALRDVERPADGVAAHTSLAGAGKHLRRWAPRAPWARWTGGVAAALVAAGLFGATRQLGTRATEARRPHPTVAVIPFRNLSSDSSHAYFAAGLHDELLSQLAKVSSLRIVGRTSVGGYQQRSTPVRQIAEELGVGSVVEGSVQIIGNRLRVVVHLVDPVTQEDRWTEHYDRTLDDAFAVQSEIAQRIVGALGATLTAAEAGAIRAPPTQDGAAYQFYLKGLEYARRPSLRDENALAAQLLFEQALALDSTFAPAHAALAYIYWRRYDLGADRTPTRLAQSQRAAESAVRLAPGSPQGHLVLGLARHMGRGDLRGALEQFRAGLRGAPNDAELWGWIGNVHLRLGHWDSATVAFDRARRLEPRDATRAFVSAEVFHFLHRYPEAIEAYRQARMLAPDFVQARLSMAWSYVLWKGELDTLRAVLGELPPDGETGAGGGSIQSQRLNLLGLERKPDSILSLLRPAPGVAPMPPLARAMGTAWAQGLRGDSSAARAAYQSALVLLDSALRTDPDNWGLHGTRGMVLARLGRRADALREARWLEQSNHRREDRREAVAVLGLRALILVHAGETDAALVEIERTLTRPSLTTVHMLRLDSSYDPIRSDPRFQALLVKYADPALR